MSGDDSPTGLGFVLSLLGIVVLFHATSNLPLTIFFEEDIARSFLIYAALMVVAAAAVVAATGRATLSRSRPRQTAVP